VVLRIIVHASSVLDLADAMNCFEVQINVQCPLASLRTSR
jgi:hypothetical protein